MVKTNDDPSKWPPLGRAISWVDQPGSLNKIIVALAVVCTLAVLAQLLYEPHPYVDVEKIFGFYAGYGFVMCVLLVICAKGMRIFLKRDETYYAPHDVESEAYPEDGLDRERVND